MIIPLYKCSYCGVASDELRIITIMAANGRPIKKCPQCKRTVECDEIDAAKTSTTIQTLILSKDKFKDVDAAKKWVKDHGFTTHKVDEKENTFRFRQRDPGDFKKNSFRTITITEGVSAVIGVPK